MKLLCLGDSLTEGYEMDLTKRWTDQLQNSLPVEVINCGISGDTTAGMLARCSKLLQAHQPDYLIVLGGTNDLWFGLKDEYILANIHAMTRQARYLNVETIVGIPTPSVNLVELNVVHENYSECIRSFCRTLMRYCKSEERPYIDFSINMQNDHFLEDGVHPNEAGHAIMAETAKEVLEALII